MVAEVPKVAGVSRIQRKNAAAAIVTMPAARPSSPSIRLIALTISSTHATVSGTARSEPRDTTPCVGNQKKKISTLFKMSSPAARIWPATFAGADSVRRSSRRPTKVMTTAARSAP